MVSFKLAGRVLVFVATVLASGSVYAQELPVEYKSVLTTLGKTGDFKDGVLKVNIPRNDLRVTIGQRPAPTPFGFGGWVALTKGEGGHDVMMGDLVLTEDEVNPVMSAILDNGLDVTALHNHFFWEQPRVFYMHVHGMGTAADLAKRVKPAIDRIDQAAKRAQTTRQLLRRPQRRAGSMAGHWPRLLAIKGSKAGQSIRSRSGGLISTCGNTERSSTLGWVSTRGRHSREPMLTRWLPATWPCSSMRSHLSSRRSERTASTWSLSTTT